MNIACPIMMINVILYSQSLAIGLANITCDGGTMEKEREK